MLQPTLQPVRTFKCWWYRWYCYLHFPRNTAPKPVILLSFTGGAGNDTVEFGDYLAQLSGVTVEGGKGNDLIGSYNSGASTAGKFNGIFRGNRLRGAKGNDVINVDISSTSASGFVLNGNSGADTIIFSSIAAVDLNVVSGQLQGGKGNDDITYVNLLDLALT